MNVNYMKVITGEYEPYHVCKVSTAGPRGYKHWFEIWKPDKKFYARTHRRKDADKIAEAPNALEAPA